MASPLPALVLPVPLIILSIPLVSALDRCSVGQSCTRGLQATDRYIFRLIFSIRVLKIQLLLSFESLQVMRVPNTLEDTLGVQLIQIEELSQKNPEKRLLWRQQLFTGSSIPNSFGP